MQLSTGVVNQLPTRRSSELFERNIEIIFGVPGKIAHRYTELHVVFKMKKTSNSQSNQGTIKVYNLTRESRALAEQKGLGLICRAGYGKDLRNIFSGDVARVINELDGADITTTFEIGDGERAYQEARTSRSFARGASMTEVFKSVLATFGTTIGDLSNIKESKLLHGLTLSGTSREQLNYLCKLQKLEWSIQDDVIQIVKLGGTTRESAVSLSSTSGLIGIPKRKKEGGIELQCLLNPDIKPGRLIHLESAFISGNFRVETVELMGDNFSKNYYCKVEANK